MNALLILIAVIFLSLLIILLALCRLVMLSRCHRKVVNEIRKIENKLMFNSVLRAMLESFLHVSIIMWYGWRSRRVTD